MTRGAATLALLGAVLVSAAGCASEKPERVPRQPYKVVLLPVEGAERALAETPETLEDGGTMVPLALTPEEMERAVLEGVRRADAFTEVVEAPASVRATAGAYAGDELAAAADFARRANADLILRVTVKSARIRDLGENDSKWWSTFTWIMLPLPTGLVDDRTYDTNVAVEAALYEPRDTVKPTASVVAASGKQELSLYDRGFTPWVALVPPAWLTGDEKTVSQEVTRRAMEQVIAALATELRTRAIPTRFDLVVAVGDAGVAVTATTRRQLRSLEVFVDGKLAKAWAETDLAPEKGSTDDARVYRRTVDVPRKPGTEVRVVAEDEAGGREVRTVVLGRTE